MTTTLLESSLAFDSTPPFSFSAFQKNVEKFCEACKHFGEACSNRMNRETFAESVHKAIWQTVQQTQPRTAACRDGSVISFTYKYNTIQMNPKVVSDYESVVKELQHYIPRVYISLYFKQLVAQQTLVYSILSPLDSLSNDTQQLLAIIELLVQVSSTAAAQSLKYASSVLKELALYVGSVLVSKFEANAKNPFSFEEDVGQQSQDPLSIRLIKLLIENQALSYASPLIQPSAKDVADYKLIPMIFSEEYGKTLEESDYIALLKQMPFDKLKQSGLSAEIVYQNIVEPIRNGLNNIQAQSSKLLLYLSKVVMVIADQYPEICLESLITLTRSKWPSKMIASTVLSRFSWEKVDDPMKLEAAFRELYHLYNRSYSTMTDTEKSSHQTEFVNKYLILQRNIIQQAYTQDPKIAAVNESYEFPIVRVFARLADAYAVITQKIVGSDNLASYLIEVLFNFAYKSGTTVQSELALLSKLRVESCNQIKALCLKHSQLLTLFIDQVVVNVAFLMRTQPNSMEGLIVLIKDLGIERWTVGDREMELVERLLFANVPAVNTAKGAADASVKIGRTLFELINWEAQQQHSSFRALDSLLRHSSTSINSAFEWVCKMLAGKVGLTITNVSNIEIANEFIQLISERTDEMYLSVKLLLILGIVQKNFEKITDKQEAKKPVEDILSLESLTMSEEGSELNLKHEANAEDQYLKIWASLESEYGIAQSIQLLQNSSGRFLTTILKKYTACLSRFNSLEDSSAYTFVVGEVLARHLHKEQFFKEMLAIIYLNPEDPLYSKSLSLWTYILSQETNNDGCSRLLDSIIKHERQEKRAIDSIIAALKYNTFSPQTIVNFAASDRVWLAYAMVRAFPQQLPATEAPPKEENPFDQFSQIREYKLRTDSDSALWLSADIAIKLVQLQKPLHSLIYWEVFFLLYFEAIAQYGYNSFPAYLRERYTKTFAACARMFEGNNTEVFTLFQSFFTWSDEMIPGKGKFLEAKADTILPLVTGSATPKPAVVTPPIPASLTSSTTLPQAMSSSMTAAPLQKSSVIPQMATPMNALPQMAVPKSQPVPQIPQQQYPYYQAPLSRSATPSPAPIPGKQLPPQAPLKQFQSTYNPQVYQPLIASNVRPPLQTTQPPQLAQSLTRSTVAGNAQVQPVVHQHAETIQVEQQSVPVFQLQQSVAQPFLPYQSRIDSSQAKTPIPTTAAEYLDQQSLLSSSYFTKDVEKFKFINSMIKQVLRTSSTEGIFIPWESENQSSMQAKDLLQEVIRYFHEFEKLDQEWKQMDAEYIRLTQELYVNTPSTSQTKLVSGTGESVMVQFPITVIQLKTPDGIANMQENRRRFREAQKNIHFVCEHLAVLLSVVQRVALFIIDKNKDSKYQQMAEKMFFDICPTLLDMKLGRTLNQLWHFFAHYMTKIGTSYIATAPSAQPKLLQILLRSPPLPGDDSVSYVSFNDMLQLNQTTGSGSTQSVLLTSGTLGASLTKPAVNVNPVLQKMQQQSLHNQVTNSDRTMLFTAFNAGVLLEYNLIQEFVQLLGILTSEKTQLTAAELASLCNQFDVDRLFIHFAEYPEGQRFTQREEITALLNALKHALCREDLRPSMGNLLLRRCSEIAFPTEFAGFLRMILGLCKSGEYRGSDWHDIVLISQKLPQIKHDVALEWIQIISGFVPFAEPAMDSAIRLAQNLILKTQLSSYLQRVDIYSKEVDTLLDFFVECLFEGETVANLPANSFGLLLSALNAVIKEIPILIDRVWPLYSHTLSPFAIRSTPLHQQYLAQFMLSLPWNSATFHEDSAEVVEQLWQRIIYDPYTVSNIFYFLNWGFVLKEKKPNTVAAFLKLYMDVKLVSPQFIPATIKSFVENLDEYSEVEPLFFKLSAEAFAKNFRGDVLSRLVKSLCLRQDPSAAIIENAEYLTAVALKMRDRQASEACAKEIRSLIWLILKSKQTGASWYLPFKANTKLIMNSLIPLAQRCPSSLFLTQMVLTSFIDLENGARPLVYETALPFASLGTECPFEDSVVAAHVNSGNSTTFQTMRTKTLGLVIHFCANADETLCGNVLQSLMYTNILLPSACEILEETLHSFLKCTASPTPRDAAANLLLLPQHMTMYSQSLNALLDKAVEKQSALLLSVLLHKFLAMAIQSETQQTAESITLAYAFAMEYIIKFVPTASKEYAVIYLYFLALEIIDSAYWDLLNPIVADRNTKFEQIISYLGTKQTKEIMKNISKQLTAPKAFHSVKLTNATCLACKAVHIFMLSINGVKKSGFSGDGGRLLNTSNLSAAQRECDALLKIGRENKVLANDFASFFQDVVFLATGNIDHQQFRDIVQKLFPLLPYLSRV